MSDLKPNHVFSTPQAALSVLLRVHLAAKRALACVENDPVMAEVSRFGHEDIANVLQLRSAEKGFAFLDWEIGTAFGVLEDESGHYDGPFHQILVEVRQRAWKLNAVAKTGTDRCARYFVRNGLTLILDLVELAIRAALLQRPQRVVASPAKPDNVVAFGRGPRARAAE